MNSDNMAATNSAANNSPALPNNRRETANENLLNNRMPDELAMNFAALPNREREAVRQSLETGNIVVSEDLTLLREVPTRRGAEDITPIAPRNEATIEPAPVFRWQTTENAEYQITVTDRAGGEVAKSAALAENVWQIDKNLAAGFYFWKIAARNKGSNEFSEKSPPTMFKVLSQMEKREIETAKTAVKSNLVGAILSARAGLLAEAERELNAELRKNPNSAKARKMLRQVRNWRKN